MKLEKTVLPEGIKGWSWGAFLLNWIWAISNKTWIGLLCFVPVVGIVMPFILGFKGREWAWENNSWESVEHFNRVQKKWSTWGIGLTLGFMVIGGLAAGFAFLYPTTITQQEVSVENTPSSQSVEVTTITSTSTPVQETTPAPVATLAANLSGTWSSDIVNDVTLEQSENKITGRYEYADDDEITQSGTLDGLLEGNVLKGKWQEHPKNGKGKSVHGDLELTMSSDSKTLQGWYRNEDDTTKETWIMVRK